MVIDKNKNNQISDEDEEPTVELEPLSEEVCARLALADDSPVRSDSVSEIEGTEEDSVDAEAPISAGDASLIRELQDELKFREEMNSILQHGIDQEREKCRTLAEQVSSLQVSSKRFSDQLEQSRRQETETKKKLAEARDSEKALLINLKRLGKADYRQRGYCRSGRDDRRSEKRQPEFDRYRIGSRSKTRISDTKRQ